MLKGEGHTVHVIAQAVTAMIVSLIDTILSRIIARTTRHRPNGSVLPGNNVTAGTGKQSVQPWI